MILLGKLTYLKISIVIAISNKLRNKNLYPEVLKLVGGDRREDG
jgi:hypothetical protein